ncbi:MAG: Uma2 family endonuclease [Chloroflexi bacterium]|nr:Uma2 family endonuclease [Chloroflexota bacterium]
MVEPLGPATRPLTWLYNRRSIREARATGVAVAVEQSLVSAEDLLRLPDDGLRYELVRGELRTAPPAGFEHGRIAFLIGRSLGNFVQRERLGEVAGTDVGFILTTNPDTVRAPDVAFVRAERIRELRAPQTGYWPGAPDLAIEVISPNDLYTEVDEKVADLLEHGTRLVFVVNPRRHTVSVHRPGQPVTILAESDLLNGEDVVPGWSLPIADIFLQS